MSMKAKLLLLALLSIFMFGLGVVAQEQSSTSEAEETVQTTQVEEAEQASQVDEPEASEEVPVVPTESETETDSAFEPEVSQTGATEISADELNPIELSYRVSAESDTLLADVEDAFMAWQDASVGAIEAKQLDGATTVFESTDSSLVGPDVITMKLTQSGVGEQGASRQVQILVAEDFRGQNSNIYESALLHEVGVLAGIPLNGSGVMQRELSAEVVPEVSVSEARALEEQATAAEEDIDRDGQVDFYDLVEFAKNFTEFPEDYSADITGDGVINDEDVDRLKEVYEFSDPVDSNREDSNSNETDSGDETPTNETPVDEPRTDEATEEQTPVDDASGTDGIDEDAAAKAAAATAAQAAENKNESNSENENSTQETDESTSENPATPPDDGSEGQ